MSVENPTFPWAKQLDAEQLSAFVEDLWGAAGGDEDLVTLAAIEKVIAEHRPDDAPVHQVPSPLRQRELRIITLLANGETHDSVARSLDVSTHTVRNLLTEIYGRINVQNAVQAVAVAMHHGWLHGLQIPQLPPPPAQVQHLHPRAWRAIYRQQVTKMRAEPGARVPIGPYASYSGSHNAAWRMRKGLLQEFQPRGAFDAQAIRTQHGHWVVLARYLGEPTEPVSAESTEGIGA